MALNIKYIALSGGGVLTVCGVAVGMSYLPKGKSMRQKLMNEGKELMKFTKEFPVVFGVFKDDGELIKLINTGDPEITIDSTSEVGGAAVENWCNKNLENYESNAKTRVFLERYCTKAPETYKQKLIKQGKKEVTDWKAKLTSIRSTATDEELLKDLKNGTTKPTSLGEADASEALSKWCTENRKKPLSNEELKKKGFGKRCFND